MFVFMTGLMGKLVLFLTIIVRVTRVTLGAMFVIGNIQNQFPVRNT